MSHNVKARGLSSDAAGIFYAEGASLRVLRFKGGYVQPENVPQLSYSTAAIVQAVAAPGASSELRVTLNNGQRYKATAPLSADLTVSGAGGLDTGSEAVSTWYNVFAVPAAADDGTFVLVLSTANSATGPTGFTAWKHLGWIRNDGSSNIVKFYQDGRFFAYEEPPTAVGSIAANVTRTNIDVSAYVPVGTKLAEFDVLAVAGNISLYADGAPTEAIVEAVNGPGVSDWSSASGAVPVLSEIIEYVVTETPTDGRIRVRGWYDAELRGESVQTQGQYLPDTKGMKGTWATGTTVNFAARPGQPSTSRWTAQSGKQRTASGTLAWSDANNVADLGWDEAASQAAGDKWIYFYQVPKSGDDSQFTIRASDNAPSTGPAGYTDWKLVWAAYRASASLMTTFQTGNKFTAIEQTVSIGAGTDVSPVQQSLTLYVPDSAAEVIMGARVEGNGATVAWAGFWIDGEQSGSRHDFTLLKTVSGTQMTRVELPTPTTPKALYYQRNGTDLQLFDMFFRGWVDDWIDS